MSLGAPSPFLLQKMAVYIYEEVIRLFWKTYNKCFEIVVQAVDLEPFLAIINTSIRNAVDAS
jgi:hypothetical protein